LWLALALAGGCGPGATGGGDLQVRLRWIAPDPGGARGVLSGIVDQVRLEARRADRVEREATCDYEQYGCALLDVPAGGGLEVRAEGLADGLVAFRGSAADVQVRADELASVEVVMQPAYPVDVYAPAAVDDLAGAWLGAGEGLELTWTATGDDGRLGRASRYDLRWSSEPIDGEAAFEAAPQVDGPTTPRAAGGAERSLLRGLPSGPVYVRLKVLDDATPPNASGLSNEVRVDVP
jgi:hypothetical protein